MDESRALFEEDREVSLTFARGLDLLEAFAGDQRSLTISELSTRTGFNRAVTRRLVRTLEKKGYAEYSRGEYTLSPRVLRLIRGFVEGRSLPQICNPILRQASAAVGESVSFAMLDELEAVYVAHAPLPSRFTLDRVSTGVRVPLVPTAVGRCMLAAMPETDARLLAHRLGLDPQALTQIRRDYAAGYATSSGEFVTGVASLAVAVLNGQGRLCGALAIIVPVDGTQSEAEILAKLPVLRRAAEDLGGAL